MVLKQIKDELKNRGYRSSKHRDEVLSVLDKAEKPLTMNDIYARTLKASPDAPDQSTAYRIVEMLAKNGFVKVISLLEGQNRYELERGDHHHHLVCTECQCIESVHLGGELEKTEAKIEAESDFKITSHSLEFFGVCKDCQAN